MKKKVNFENLINKRIIEDYIKTNNLTKTKFCKICRISIDTFNRIMTGKDFRLIALFKIAKTINIKFYQMFNY